MPPCLPRWSFGLLFMVFGLAFACMDSALPEPPLSAQVRITSSREPRPVNRLLSGNNLQWVDRGDELLKPNSLELDLTKVERIKALGPTVLRYPGGSLSDLYNWRLGLGPMHKRGTNSRFHGPGRDRVLFGTLEFLRLCQAVGAEPLITVNVTTGTPKDAVEWLNYIRQLKSEGNLQLPSVRYWEIGNEPYLIGDHQKDLALEPEEFAQRANALIRQLRAADPLIRVGLPLRSERLGGLPATPLPKYNDRVLSNIKEKFDFACLHNAYLPFIRHGKYSGLKIFKASMAAVRVVKDDLKTTRTLLEKYFPDRSIPLAITEYNSLFTINGSASDQYIASLAASIYLADLIRVLSLEKDILMANYWSLSGNWFFGAMDRSGRPRPSYALLKNLKKLWRGRNLEIGVTGPTFDTERVGYVPAQTKVPTVEGMGTIEGNHVGLMLINKHSRLRVEAQITSHPDLDLELVQSHQLTAPEYFSSGPDSPASTWKKVDFPPKKTPCKVFLEPHSLTYLEGRTKK